MLYPTMQCTRPDLPLLVSRMHKTTSWYMTQKHLLTHYLILTAICMYNEVTWQQCNKRCALYNTFKFHPRLTLTSTFHILFSWTALRPSSRQPRIWWTPSSSRSKPPTWPPPSTRRCTARRRSTLQWCPGAWKPPRRNLWWSERNPRSARPASGGARKRSTSPPSKPSANSRPWTHFNSAPQTPRIPPLSISYPLYGLLSPSCILFRAATCVYVPTAQ